MKVVSRLVNMDFKVGKISKKDHHLIIISHESQPMKVNVSLSPVDIADFIKAAFNWTVISYVLLLPLIYRRYKKDEGNKPE